MITSPSPNPVNSSNSLIVAEVEAPFIVYVFSFPKSAEPIVVAAELRLPAPINSKVPSASAWICTVPFSKVASFAMGTWTFIAVLSSFQ